MNRKNNRIKAQIVDILLKEFNDPVNWIREIDYTEDELQEGYLDHLHRADLSKLIRSKLDTTKTIKLRLSITSGGPSKSFKNDPGLLVDLKVNRSKLFVDWKVAPNFGKHEWGKLSGCSVKFDRYWNFFNRLQDFIDLNYKQCDYQTEQYVGKIRKTASYDQLIQVEKVILREWDKVKHIQDQKEFANAIKGNPFANLLFGQKSGKNSSVYVRLARMNFARQKALINAASNLP